MNGERIKIHSIVAQQLQLDRAKGIPAARERHNRNCVHFVPEKKCLDNLIKQCHYSEGRAAVGRVSKTINLRDNPLDKKKPRTKERALTFHPYLGRSAHAVNNSPSGVAARQDLPPRPPDMGSPRSPPKKNGYPEIGSRLRLLALYSTFSLISSLPKWRNFSFFLEMVQGHSR